METSPAIPNAPPNRTAIARSAPQDDAYWRAANIFPSASLPLLQSSVDEAAQMEHVKPRLLGHWGTRGADFYLRAASIASSISPIWTHLYLRTRARWAGDLWPIRIWGNLREGVFAHHRRRRVMNGCSSSSLSRGINQPTSPPDTPGSIPEGASWDTALVHAFGAAVWIIRISRCVHHGDGETETWPAGVERAFPTIPQPGGAMARLLPILLQTATRSPIPPCSPASPRGTSRSNCCGVLICPVCRRGQ